jgi:hypothetical protein
MTDAEKDEYKQQKEGEAKKDLDKKAIDFIIERFNKKGDFKEFVKAAAKTDAQRAIRSPEEWQKKVGFELKMKQGPEEKK